MPAAEAKNYARSFTLTYFKQNVDADPWQCALAGVVLHVNVADLLEQVQPRNDLVDNVAHDAFALVQLEAPAFVIKLILLAHRWSSQCGSPCGKACNDVIAVVVGVVAGATSASHSVAWSFYQLG